MMSFTNRRFAAAALACLAGLGAATAARAQCSGYTITAGGTQAYVTTGTFDFVPDSDGSVSGDGDDGTYPIAFPFPVNFYGGNYTSARVSNNGYIQFTGPDYLGFDTQPLPAALVNGAAIFAYWNDLFAYDTPGDGIYTQTVGAAPNRQFIVDWRQASYDSATARGAFQVIFTEGSDSFTIAYASSNNTLNGQFGTIGVQAASTGPQFTQFADWQTNSVPPGTSLTVSCVSASVPGACCAPDGTCTAVPVSQCVSPNNPQAAGTTCAAVACPSNDDCATALPLTFNTQVTGQLQFASVSPVATLCTGSTRDVYYTFTAPAAGVYAVTLTPTGVNPQSLSIASACAGTFDDDLFCSATSGTPTTSTGLSLGAGQTITIRVGDFGGQVNSSFNLVVTTAPVGCCFANGVCVLAPETACAGAGGTNSGAAVCDPSPCTPPTNTACSSAQPIAANTWVLGNNSALPAVQAVPAASCQANSIREMWYVYTASATDTHGVTTCGSPQDVVLSVYTVGNCADTSTWAQVACDDDTCTGASPDASVLPIVPGVPSALAADIATVAFTAGTQYYIRVTRFGTTQAGGNFQVRVNAPQAAANVVCCRGTTCAVIAAANCTLSGPASGTQAVARPALTSCTGVANTLSGCCYADYDKSGSRTIDDIFIYLNGWFANSPYTQVGGDGSGARTIDDIFLFLNSWFAGCS